MFLNWHSVIPSNVAYKITSPLVTRGRGFKSQWRHLCLCIYISCVLDPKKKKSIIFLLRKFECVQYNNKKIRLLFIFTFLKLRQQSNLILVAMLILQRKQNTVTRDKIETELIARGRHDPCVVPRGTYQMISHFCC